MYHTIGLVATSYNRTLRVPCSQYVDDRHNGQLVTPAFCTWSDFEKAEAASYIVASVLTTLGYTLALSKSQLIPSQSVRFLGYLSDSLLQAFILPQDKKDKFKQLREAILSSNSVDLRILQKFARKTSSFSIAVPAARLHTRAISRAIGSFNKRPHPTINITNALRQEIAYWRFLDDWEGHLPWLDERHVALEFFVDASNSGWGAVLDPHSDNPTTLRDYWAPEDLNKPIIIREALALQQTLSAGNLALRNDRVDAYTDNLPLVQAWNREGSQSSDLTNVIKTIFELTLRFNVGLKLHHIPSKANLADTPSRALSKADCMLAKQSWSTLHVAGATTPST